MYNESKVQNGIYSESGDFDNHSVLAAKQKETPIASEYGKLEKEVVSLGEVCDELRRRLEGVTGPELPTASDGSKSDIERSLSPFGESIRSDCQRVKNIRANIQNLISRLEI